MARFKALALICCIVSLFVQSAAYAAAPSHSAMSVGANCAEMPAHAGSQTGTTAPSDQPGCCADMASGCVGAVGCAAPLAMTGPAQPVSTPAPINPAIYAALVASSLYGAPLPPEFPPPQTGIAM